LSYSAYDEDAELEMNTQHTWQSGHFLIKSVKKKIIRVCLSIFSE